MGRSVVWVVPGLEDRTTTHFFRFLNPTPLNKSNQNLSDVFSIQIMLVFLVDQAPELSCWLFQTPLEKVGTKRDM